MAMHRGDGVAGDQFVARHLPAVWRYARVIARDDARAEDVVQDTFVAVLRGPDGFRGTGSARPWLLVIARNAWHRQHRRRVGEPAAFEPVDEEQPLAALGLAAGWGANPERAAVAAEDGARVATAMALLSEAEREVVWLRDVEGLDGDRVAETLGITVAAMKSRLHRARLTLMSALREGGSNAQ